MLHAVPSLIMANLFSTFAHRAAFLLRASMMFVNNLLFFVMWIVLYRHVDEVNGWTISDMYLLFAVSNLTFGVASALFSGFLNLPSLVRTGGLDSMLLKPVSPLVQVITSRPDASAFGDILSGFLFLWFSGYTSASQLALFVFVCLFGAVTFVAFGVICFSIIFWLSEFDEIAQQLFGLLITLSLYPESIFPLGARFLLYVLVPAGFTVFIPVTVIRHPSFENLGLLLCGGIVFSLLARSIFMRGLARYESGNKWSIHAG